MRVNEVAGFLPLVYRLAVRLEQMTWNEFAFDVANFVYALRSAQRSMGYQFILNNFDLGVEAGDREHSTSVNGPGQRKEARLAVIVEATQRLCAERRDQRVIGLVTGPRTLAPLIAPAEDRADALHEAADLMVDVARRYCEAGVDVLIIAEDANVDGVSRVPELAPLIRQTLNMAHYYAIPCVLLQRDRTREAVREAIDAGLDAVIGERHGEASTDQLIDAMPTSVLSQEPAAIIEWLRLHARNPLSTSWEVPSAVKAENVALVARALASVAA